MFRSRSLINYRSVSTGVAYPYEETALIFRLRNLYLSVEAHERSVQLKGMKNKRRERKKRRVMGGRLKRRRYNELIAQWRLHENRKVVNDKSVIKFAYPLRVDNAREGRLENPVA